MTVENLKIIASRLELGLFSPEDLPNAAADALENGLDSQALRILAALTPSEAGDAAAMFARALTELNIPRPDTRDAVMCLARDIARAVLRGILTPYEGANQISDLSLHLENGSSHALDPFVYASSEWEDRPQDRRAFEDGIKAAARDLIGIVLVQD